MENATKPCPMQVTARWQRTAFSETNFWAIIEGLGWGRRTTNHKAIQKDLMSRLSPQQADKMRRLLDKKTSQLARSITLWEKENETLPVGDDSYSDLLAHIVGMGRKEFEKTLRNPELAYERALKDDFKESFSYAVPDAADYRKRQDPKSGDRFQPGQQIVLGDLPPQFASAYQAAAKEMQRNAVQTLQALGKADVALAEAQKSRAKVQDLFKKIRKYVTNNSPEGVRDRDMWIQIPDGRLSDLRLDSSPVQIAEMMEEAASQILKSP